MQKIIRKEIELAGKKLVLETGELAGQASGSVLASYGETVVLATAVSQTARPDVDFFPLAVDYEERLYAGGKISTSRFIKREGRPSEEAILTSRLIDRAIRPLFPKDYQAEVQVVITVLSVDQANDPDVVSLIAASCALSISDIPWDGPIAAVRIGRQNGGFILNPTEEEKTFSSLDLVVASTRDEIVMIEAAGQEVEEKSMAQAVKFALEQGEIIVSLIGEFVKEAGRQKQQYEVQKLDPKKEEAIKKFIQDNLIKELELPSKAESENWFGESLEKIENEFLKEDQSQLSGNQEITTKILSAMLDDAVSEFLRKQILVNKKRIDGRAPEEIRSIKTKVGILPRTHGSGFFERGETQVLSIATLASPALEQLIEGMSKEGTKRYMHHYNFPPFSTGEVRRLGSPGRREIGHGALAERALLPVLPSNDAFPYTIRVVSEVLSSAGSTSMASVCGSTLALMDAGVPIKEPVAGISIGLISDKKDKSKYLLLTDIAYQEDAQGDMDFKVAGTKNGINVIQMDTKLNGITVKIVEEALEKARKARLAILEKILSTIPGSRKTISPHAPTVILVRIDPSKIGEVIGSGGRTINKIISETGVAIDINDEGTVTISGKDAQACQKAAQWVEGIVKEPQPGEVYEGKVKRILPFGAMVEILPGKEGLVHVSRLASYRVDKVEDIVKIGQTVKVRVAEIDDQGRVNLSMNLEGDAVGSARHQGDQRRDFVHKRFDNRRTGSDRRRPPKRY
ncbi:polyribonucleotide nucleotidyltransferase [Candidatus Curtissbacteria bacterium RIFCSPHIGHO2_01_FULL_41_44]|uniref:Polyribonucleotide nucleotidyltransferase n=1 Tax=Candidatus Curtissbacteria bacterium RIFCSPLOWO2_01_FULL_42_50 TaxID=1797730 RepID=A0A1F5H4A2_9BACT|nr:MAG: polyribonucleotide nucleotidyltransferase [Candidatus Curtissbacteria bacterium RIFCSPHIGHO2_01_FULL_41_44]OGD93394.1 MAG: polyribonucleotide nucleotidyltransferase [Candidatus Curtissbacteria bacterium RIFCSPHIGHO2_02_FULL_42_58]OGD97110.1 MAG: polyribonucleotide nucleotidyltransferase [Candidatus Curtissbacteria bacterium RIFCSPHIGHO2_12_FULL_42_33]OGD98899.1 MAG: polyribonucleotide nucleotidyltransferase [Candidatus Curtissbacteria bacterium RIFCSPLOWO2_01_FULL_42_50]OGE02998.1 MAG: 